MVNLSEIFLGEIIKVKSLVCEFKKMGWSRVSSVDMGAGNFYWSYNVAKYRVIE